MKKLIHLTSLALATVVTSAGQPPSDAYILSEIVANSDVRIIRGMTFETVRILLNTPNETIGTNVWVYWDFNNRGGPKTPKYDTLVVTFKDGAVSSLRLCELKSLRELIAKLKAQPAAKIAAAK